MSRDKISAQRLIKLTAYTSLVEVESGISVKCFFRDYLLKSKGLTCQSLKAKVLGYNSIHMRESLGEI